MRTCRQIMNKVGNISLLRTAPLPWTPWKTMPWNKLAGCAPNCSVILKRIQEHNFMRMNKDDAEMIMSDVTLSHSGQWKVASHRGHCHWRCQGQLVLMKSHTVPRKVWIICSGKSLMVITLHLNEANTRFIIARWALHKFGDSSSQWPQKLQE